MRWTSRIAWLLAVAVPFGVASSPSTSGIESFVKRRLPKHAQNFEFAVTDAAESSAAANETYIVSSSDNGKIKVEGSTVSAVMQG